MPGLDLLHALLGPARCEGCGRNQGVLCNECHMRLGSPAETAPIGGVDRTLAAWGYEGAARSLILALKLRGVRAAAGPLVAAMRAEVLARGLLGSVLTWVPCRGRDARRRGYDHAEVLARRLASALGLPAKALLARTGERADQATLGAAARRENLRGAFAAEACPFGVVLVDDLVTTGATAEACAKALRAAGAESIEVVVPCRA